MADDLLGVGIEQQLVGIEAMAGRRLVGTVDAEAVDRAGAGIGQVAVPYLIGIFGQHDALDLAFAPAIEEAKLDLCRIRREQSKVNA